MKLPPIIVSAWLPSKSEEADALAIAEAYRHPRGGHKKVLRLVAETHGWLQIRTNDPAWANPDVASSLVEFCRNAGVDLMVRVPVLDKTSGKNARTIDVASLYKEVCGGIVGESVLSKKTETLYKGQQAQERLEQFTNLCLALSHVNGNNDWFLGGTDLAQSTKPEYKGFDPLVEWARWYEIFKTKGLHPAGVLQAYSDERYRVSDVAQLRIAEAAAWCRAKGLLFGINPINDVTALYHQDQLWGQIQDIWSNVKSPIVAGLTTWADIDSVPNVEAYWDNVLVCAGALKGI